MTIAVTGSQGQLGAELCRQLGPQAVGLDLPGFDLTNPAGLRERLLSIRPQVVLNTAAYTRIDLAEADAALCRSINVDGVARLVEVCRELDCGLVQLSTDHVFGGDAQRRVPYQETDLPSPQGIHAQSKLDAERIAAQWSKHLIVRTCGLYGMRSPRTAGNFVETILRLAAAGRKLRVVDDQVCTPSYVPHVARAILFLVQSGVWGTFHVVNAGQTTWYGMAAEVVRGSGLNASVEPITTAEYGPAAPRPAFSVLDTAKYHALPDRPPMPDWNAALREYLARRSGAAV